LPPDPANGQRRQLATPIGQGHAKTPDIDLRTPILSALVQGQGLWAGRKGLFIPGAILFAFDIQLTNMTDD
jgi:hypothetical protein